MSNEKRRSEVVLLEPWILDTLQKVLRTDKGNKKINTLLDEIDEEIKELNSSLIELTGTIEYDELDIDEVFKPEIKNLIETIRERANYLYRYNKVISEELDIKNILAELEKEVGTLYLTVIPKDEMDALLLTGIKAILSSLNKLKDQLHKIETIEDNEQFIKDEHETISKLAITAFNIFFIDDFETYFFKNQVKKEKLNKIRQACNKLNDYLFCYPEGTLVQTVKAVYGIK